MRYKLVLEILLLHNNYNCRVGFTVSQAAVFRFENLALNCLLFPIKQFGPTVPNVSVYSKWLKLIDDVATSKLCNNSNNYPNVRKPAAYTQQPTP